MRLTKKILDEIENSDVEALEISYSDMSDEQDIESLVEVLNKKENIKMLRLYQCSVNDAGAGKLAATKHLTHLDLAGNSIGPDGAVCLAKNTNLVKLNLSGNQIGLDGAEALAKNKTLEELILAGCKLGGNGAKAVLSTKSSILTKLDLSTNDISGSDVQGVGNQALKYLNLSQNYIDDSGAESITSNFPNLTLLNLGTNSIGDPGAKAVALHENLVGIDLRQNQITEEGFRALCKNKNIQTLCIYGNQISFSEGLLPIANSIVHLDLSFNQINDDHETVLKSIASFPKLKELMLEENNISDEVATKFYKEIMQVKPALETVDLRSWRSPILFSYKRKPQVAIDDFSNSKAMRLTIKS